MGSYQATLGEMTDRRRLYPGGGLILGALLVCAVSILVWCPLATRLELGGDEGYELQKARLVHQGWRLYRDIWNDQPPLHTWMLSLLFRVLGEEALWGRLLSLAAALWLGWNVGYWSRRGIAGPVGGALALVLLFSTGSFFTWSISAMLEAPAAAAGMTAVRIADSRRFPDWQAGLVTGAVMGLAAQVKMTALLYCPACLVVLWLRQNDVPARQKWLPWTVSTGTFVAGVVLGFYMIAALWPGELSGLWSHFSPLMRTAFSRDYHFDWNWLSQEPALLLLGALFPTVAARSQWRYCLPFSVNFASTLLVLQIHRPVWPLYTLHLLVPAAILATVSLQAGWESLRLFFTRKTSPTGILQRSTGLVALVYCLVMAPTHLVWQIRLSRLLDTTLNLELVEHMQQCRSLSDRAFSVRPIIAFQAGMLTPPRTTVLPEKRVRLEPGLREVIAEDLEQWRPGAVYLYARFMTPRIQALLDRDYDLVFQERTDYLYLRKDIARSLRDTERSVDHP